MKVLLFQPRFADLVRSGAKTQTIRRDRKHPIKVGDQLSLRRWTGKPYRSKQEVLGAAQCVAEIPCLIYEYGAMVGTNLAVNAEGFALKDGFASFEEMREWFDSTHGLPFSGTLIRWRLTA